MALSNATVIVHPIMVNRLRMIDLAEWAWRMDRHATLRDTRSGNSLVVLEPIRADTKATFSKIFRRF